MCADKKVRLFPTRVLRSGRNRANSKFESDRTCHVREMVLGARTNIESLKTLAQTHIRAACNLVSNGREPWKCGFVNRKISCFSKSFEVRRGKKRAESLFLNGRLKDLVYLSGCLFADKKSLATMWSDRDKNAVIEVLALRAFTYCNLEDSKSVRIQINYEQIQRSAPISIADWASPQIRLNPAGRIDQFGFRLIWKGKAKAHERMSWTGMRTNADWQRALSFWQFEAILLLCQSP